MSHTNTHFDYTEDKMFKHKAKDGTRNLCGKKIAVLRKNLTEKHHKGCSPKKCR